MPPRSILASYRGSLRRAAVLLAALALALTVLGIGAANSQARPVKPLTGEPRYPSAAAEQAAYHTPGTSGSDGLLDAAGMEQGVLLLGGLGGLVVLMLLALLMQNLLTARR